MEPFKKVFYTNSPEETIELGRQIGSRLKGGEIIAYKGGLGAGKTTIPWHRSGNGASRQRFIAYIFHCQ